MHKHRNPKKSKWIGPPNSFTDIAHDQFAVRMALDGKAPHSYVQACAERTTERIVTDYCSGKIDAQTAADEAASLGSSLTHSPATATLCPEALIVWMLMLELDKASRASWEMEEARVQLKEVYARKF